MRSFLSYISEKSDAISRRHTLTATVWNKVFIDGQGVSWSPNAAPEIVPASSPLPSKTILINKRNVSKNFLMNLVLHSPRREPITVSKYLSSYDGGITNEEFREKVGLKRSTSSSSKITVSSILAGAPVVSLNIGRPGAEIVEQFYAFQDADVMIDLIAKNLEKALPDKNMVGAVISFLKRGCDHMNWPPDTTDAMKVVIAQVLSEIIIGICLLKNTSFSLKDKAPFNDVADTFYLPVKSSLATIDFVIKMRNGNILKFSSKVEEGASAAFGPRLKWAVFESSPSSFVHKATRVLMSGTRIGELINIMKARGPKKIKESVYAYAFSLMDLDDVEFWIGKTSSQTCDQSSIPVAKKEELLTKVRKYLATNSRLSTLSAFKELVSGNLCALSIAVRYIVADAINNDPKSQKPMLFVLRMFDYHQLNLNKSAFMSTGSVRFTMKSFTGGTSRVNRILIDPGKATLKDTSGAYGFLNFRLE